LERPGDGERPRDPSSFNAGLPAATGEHLATLDLVRGRRGSERLGVRGEREHDDALKRFDLPAGLLLAGPLDPPELLGVLLGGQRTKKEVLSDMPTSDATRKRLLIQDNGAITAPLPGM
jgi:hypothetical protein